MANTQGRATVQWQTFDPQRLVFSTQATTNKNKGKMVKVEYLDPSTNERVPFRWQSPRQKIPFGVSRYPPPGQEDPNVMIKYSLPQNLTDEAYLAFLRAVDTRNLEITLERQAQWFPGKTAKTAEILGFSYCPIVKPTPEGKDYPPTTKFKCPFRYSKIETKFWNENRELIASSEVQPQSEAVTVNEFGNLWFIQAQWGAQTQVNQAKIYAASDAFAGTECPINDEDMKDSESCPVEE